MDTAMYKVVYVDRRVSLDRDLQRDDPLPIITSTPTGGGHQFYADDGEVVANLQAILSVFTAVSICTSGPSCLSKLNNLNNPLETPTLVIIDIPRTKHVDEVGKHDSGVAAGPSGPIYGLSLLRFLCLEIEKSRTSELVIPIALVSGAQDTPREQVCSGAFGERTDSTWADEDDEASRLTRSVDCGALDVLISPFSQERVKALSLHCYRAEKKLCQNESKARKLSWVGGPAVQQSNTNDYAYLREKMVSELMTDIINPQNAQLEASGSLIQVTQARKDVVSRLVGKWHFSAHEFTDVELLQAAHTMFEHAFTMPEVQGYRIPSDRLTDFLITSRAAYNEQIPYHNFRHVVDVLQAVFVMLVQLGALPPYSGSIIPPESLNKTGVASLIRPADALCLMIAAIGHDVGHPGVNNAFLVKLKAPLAQLYNDKSVLESFHCAAFSQVLRRHWPEALDLDLRKLMIDTILATDMALHFDYMAKLASLKQHVQASGGVESWDEKTTAANRTILCSILIKCADISNVARGHDCAAQWATILIEEFSRQASMEKDLGIPSSLVAAPMMGNILALAKSQTGFMDLFAIPLFKSCAEVMPALRFTVEELTLNIQKWTLTIKDCEERKLSASSTENSAPRTTDELEITLHNPREHASTDPPGPQSESVSHRSSYEWSDRSGQSSIANRANARSSTSSPFDDSRPSSEPQDNSRRSSATVPSDIPIDRPLSASSTDPSTYKGSPSQNAMALTPPAQNGNTNGQHCPKKEKASYNAFPPPESPPSPALLGVNPPVDRPRSSPPDLGETNGKNSQLTIATQTVERRPSRFFRKFWNKKKN
ncbi:HD-domain/PDEase-like protein [Terfezia boudieri ATCC MYA-4762]|uniref:Phosphodiesterase n=1 Tax=Terfezia boudieri ATCC MYA-4762 TaxID=1051890 RepID=A0A3N4M2Z3_9PEZI|nr:HD-domain/PDEase-like protein [Terfezia boudieri ATCC MYA-4762]